MRILHTSDWHAGRIWKNQNRLPALQNVLEYLGDFIERERIDVVLVSGDVFDSVSPSPEAERAVTQFFLRIGRAGIQSVVIAGNHDHHGRLETWGLLAELVGVHSRGLPRRRSNGGVVELTSASGERACIAAIPFAPVGRIVEALELARDEVAARQKYAEAIQVMLDHLAGGFQRDAVNLVVAHTHVSGARVSGSERLVTLGDDWAATPQALPAVAQYVALGHIHRPQRIDAAGPHTEYAGSALQLDFGEVGEEKTFVVVDVLPGRPPIVERIPYVGGDTLSDWSGTWSELEQASTDLASAGYVRLGIALDVPMPDVNRRARQLVPNAVVVEATQPTIEPVLGSVGAPSASVGGDGHRLAPDEHFRAYFVREHQRPPREETVGLFNELYGVAAEE